MTREEAIEELKKVDTLDMPARLCKAYWMAINSLEIDERYELEYEQAEPKTDVLDEIRAEIIDEKDFAYADFDRYKEEVLYVEPDELPDDDYRYGMERCIEIIDKYKTESEEKNENNTSTGEWTRTVCFM